MPWLGRGRRVAGRARRRRRRRAPSSWRRTSCWPTPAVASSGDLDPGLDGVDLLAVLDVDDRAVLAELLVTETYDAGELILREGEPADRLCLLVSGSATVRIDLVDHVEGVDRTMRLRSFGPGHGVR